MCTCVYMYNFTGICILKYAELVMNATCRTFLNI